VHARRIAEDAASHHLAKQALVSVHALYDRDRQVKRGPSPR
jgi:hypothetical protein